MYQSIDILTASFPYKPCLSAAELAMSPCWQLPQPAHLILESLNLSMFVLNLLIDTVLHLRLNALAACSLCS